MTNLEYLIQKENIRELAEKLINIKTEEDIDEDYEGNSYVCGLIEHLICSDGYDVWYFTEEDWNDAIEHEIKWLFKERKE